MFSKVYLDERLVRQQANKQNQHEFNSCNHSSTLSKERKNSTASQNQKSQLYFKNSSYQGSQDFSINFQQSEVSLQENIVQEHLAYLQLIIDKISKKIFQMPSFLQQTSSQMICFQQTQHDLRDYLLRYQSLIPVPQLPDLIKFLEYHRNFYKVLNWIYQNVQAQLGNELILISHKILLAYMPMKNLINNRSALLSLANHPFNIHNIYCDFRIKFLSFSFLYEYDEQGFIFNQQLFSFYQNFLKTILLVLQQYFQNPGYAETIAQKQQRKRKERQQRKKKEGSKTKKIKKNHQSK